ncbi:MAG: geranylgeranylglycerol-phosphate geranylgeranyltransferase [Prevotellaceae bacterium]|jgi:4-hydroxybenzoate polyprenyltransferase|nr:geranylgeranylglycerol-phosphate geranylgeranyltransferase [Prevotellaceae bacterium]
MKDYFRLVRFTDLLFLAIIQILMYFAVVQPVMQMRYDSEPHYSPLLYLLIAASVLIAAGGYVLNDYFDIKIDKINKPDKLIVTNSISRKKAMLIYRILTLSGLVAGIILAIVLSSFTVGFIFIVTAGLLWFYSASYKRQFITGNLIIAFLAALGVLTVAIFQIAILEKMYGSLIFDTNIPALIYTCTGGFAAFAFIVTWLREIIKDIEDIEGDREMECRTMPIKWGIKRTKIVVIALICIVICALAGAVRIIPFAGTITFRYVLFFIFIPLTALTGLVVKAKTSAEFRSASLLVKLIMIAGVLYSVIFYYEIAKHSKIPFFDLFFVK